MMTAMRRTQTETEKELLRVAAFILFDAAVFHEVLAGTHPTVQSLRNAAIPLQTFLDEQWAAVLDIDYAPVFTLARDVIRSFPTSPNTEDMLRRIIAAALEVAASGVLLRHDFMGRVYHRMLLRTTGEFYATYYTSIPAAWLLSNLAVGTPHPRWSFGTLDEIRSFRLIDPACGSGTLLSAAYMAIKHRYVCARQQVPRMQDLHRALVENVIEGWDILDYATHLTLTTLALHSNQATIRDSKVWTVPAGVDADGQVYLGSLDVLDPQRPFVGWGFTAPAVQRGMAGDRERAIQPERQDLVIMNPPFSRSAKPNVKFGYSTPAAKAQMTRALQSLTKRVNASGIGKAGLGAYFMLLGLGLAKDDGRIAIVVPRSMLSGVSWQKVRERYIAQCEIEYIVSNYDPGNPDEGVEPWCWSENTALGEVLIVARRVPQGAGERYCTYVNLWRKPKNEVEALLISHQVIRERGRLVATLRHGEWSPIRLVGGDVGCMYRVAQTDLARNWLMPCVFASPELNEMVLDLLTGPYRCQPAGHVSQRLGADIRQVKEHFAQADRRTTWPVVWGHQSDMNTVALRPGHLGSGRMKRGEASRRLHNANAATLLVAERPHLSTECLLAMEAPEAALATAFWEVRPNDDHGGRVMLLWLNSTYGFLQYLGCATSSMGDIFKLKKDHLAHVPSADPAALDMHQVQQLLDEIIGTEFLPFGDEFARAAAGAGPRRRIDGFLQRELGLPLLTTRHYQLLAQDPVVTKIRL
jgi:hypothetical protein